MNGSAIGGFVAGILLGAAIAYMLIANSVCVFGHCAHF